jgi:hypothetical protein
MKPMLRTAALIGLFTFASSPAFADGVAGRYQAIVVPRPGAEPRVLLLDTRDGQLWQWWHLDSGEGDTGITYLGKLVPGTKAGDVVEHFPAALP